MSTADGQAVPALDLAVRAEREKLARVIEMPVDQLGWLDGVSAANIQRLRQRISQTLYDARRDRFQRLEWITRFLPDRYVARLAVEALGPLLSARVVGEMDPLRARNIARHVPAAFVADVAPHIDPAKVQTLIPQLPVELVRDAALILVERGDFVTMGRFADGLSSQALRAVITAIDDDAALLRTGYLLDRRDQLSRIVHNIDNDRIARLMVCAAEQQLLPEALFIIEHVDGELKARLADLVGRQSEAVLDALVAVARRERLWGPVLRAIAHMQARQQRKIVNLPSVRDEALLGELVNTAYDEGLLQLALPLTRLMRPDYRRAVAHAALRQGADVALAALEAAHAGDAWPTLLDLAQHTDPAERDLLASLPVLRRREVIAALVQDLRSESDTAIAMDVLARMDEHGRAAVARALAADDGFLLDLLIDRVGDDAGRLDALVRLMAPLPEADRSRMAAVLARRSDAERAALDGAARAAGVPALTADARG
ncbi:hypothetical protein [Algiphilus sp.]|uniref:hypothetical protein n=1 Tax=Algiphilus sp. TaxID=1872431 RepID=UPI0025C72223|nr:hypothetical protein [Algiphilus sp.]MCK5768828.1 hypothetical protein [Algiphilus sp.]